MQRCMRERLSGGKALMIERANVKAARQMVPGKLALVQGSKTLKDVESSISVIDRVVASSEQGLMDAKSLIGTTQDLIESEGAIAGSKEDKDAAAGFENFLSGGKPAPAK